MAQEVDNKKTILDDDASIYKKREERDDDKTMKEKWDKLDKSGKGQFFKDYLLKPIITILVIVLFLGYLIVVTRKEDVVIVYNISTVNPFYLNEDKANAHFMDLAKMWEIQGKERVQFDTDLNISALDAENFLTYLMAGNIDVVIGTEEELALYGDFFADLSDNAIIKGLPEASVVNLTYMATTKDGEATEKVTKCCGVYLKDTVLSDSYHSSLRTDPDKLVVLMVSGGAGNKEGKSDDFLKFVLNL